jgi:hypothetical protein
VGDGVTGVGVAAGANGVGVGVGVGSGVGAEVVVDVGLGSGGGDGVGTGVSVAVEEGSAALVGRTDGRCSARTTGVGCGSDAQAAATRRVSINSVKNGRMCLRFLISFRQSSVQRA